MRNFCILGLVAIALMGAGCSAANKGKMIDNRPRSAPLPAMQPKAQPVIPENAKNIPLPR